MNDLQVFDSPEFGQVRTMMIDDMPWFIGKDVALALGYRKTDNAIRTHVDAEDRLTHQISASGQRRSMTIINESGLYSLILSSMLDSAKRFKHWVTSEVLPALRKTGTYTATQCTETVPQVPQRALTTDDYLRAANIISSCRNERLPYVLSLLQQGGIAIPQVDEFKDIVHKVKAMSVKDESGECARLINCAIVDHRLNQRELCRETGLAPTQITRIRKDQSIPTIERAYLIMDTIKRIIPELT